MNCLELKNVLSIDFCYEKSFIFHHRHSNECNLFTFLEDPLIIGSCLDKAVLTSAIYCDTYSLLLLEMFHLYSRSNRLMFSLQRTTLANEYEKYSYIRERIYIFRRPAYYWKRQLCKKPCNPTGL